MARKLYLAYGSNISRRQMRMRCPDARPLGTIMLQDARLEFRGYADCVYAKGEQVPCVLWSLTSQCIERLDRYEGSRYYKEWVELDNGKWALIYLMTTQKGRMPPSQTYYNAIRGGYEDFDLDQVYLRHALDRSFDKEKTDQLVELRKRQKQTTQHRKIAQKETSR